MAAELTIILVVEKLQNLLASKQIIDLRFDTGVNNTINLLKEFQKNVDVPLKDDQTDGGSSKIELLQALYLADDTIDTFLVKTALQKQKAIIKAFSRIQFKSPSRRFSFSNNMRKVEDQLQNLRPKLVSMSKLIDPQIKSYENEDGDDGIAEADISVPAKGEDPDRIETIEPAGPEVQAAPDYSEEETDIVGLNEERQELRHLIDNVYGLNFLIAVVGKAGSGKTTLVKTVYQSPVREIFDCCAWVSVSQFFRERDVLLQILEQVARVKNEGDLSLEVLRPKLHQILLQKRYLIVLDDVHESNVWDRLKLAFPNSLGGSRVILTVRDYNIVHAFKPSVVQLHPLSNDESWKLFLRIVRQDTSNSELMNLKAKILEKCQGLPYTIRMLGGLLSAKKFNYDEWSRILIGQTSQSALSDLSSPSLRACLLYLCLFPKSSEISVRRLFLLWLVEGLVTPSAGKVKISETVVVEEYLAELEKRKMIDIRKRRSDGRPKTCSMPSTLYDDLFPEAENTGFFHIYGISSDTPKSTKYNIRRLAEHPGIPINTSPEEDFRCLRSYMSFNIRMGDKPTDEVGNFLKTAVIKGDFGLLTVLDLEGVYKPRLPEKLGKLTLLRYVGLRRTFLDLIPESVGDLLHLETLDVKYTNITTLPFSIWKSKKLRHLYMDGINFKIPNHRSFSGGSLANLQTLTGLLIGNNNPSVNWLTGLTGLRKLGLTCHTEPLPEITKWICTRLIGLESLKLRAINERSEPSKLDLGSMKTHENLRDLYLVGELPTTFNLRDLPPKLKVLTLSVSKLSEDPMQALGEQQDLKILRLFAHSYTGKEITCHKDGFPQLRVLKLWMLKELNQCTIEDGSMPLLRELEIRCCKELQKFVGLQKVNKNNFKKLTLTNLKKDFVDKVKQSMGKIVKEEEFKFNPSWD